MKITNETRIKLGELQQEYNDKCVELIKSEARINNPYKKGDIIQDHYQTGKILNLTIRINVSARTYDIVYKCERFTKKLKPYLNGDTTYIHLCNVERGILI